MPYLFTIIVGAAIGAYIPFTFFGGLDERIIPIPLMYAGAVVEIDTSKGSIVTTYDAPYPVVTAALPFEFRYDEDTRWVRRVYSASDAAISHMRIMPIRPQDVHPGDSVVVSADRNDRNPFKAVAVSVSVLAP